MISKEQIIQQIQQRDMVITNTLFSKCGDYMVAANNHGFINVWLLQDTILHHQSEVYFDNSSGVASPIMIASSNDSVQLNGSNGGSGIGLLSPQPFNNTCSVNDQNILLSPSSSLNGINISYNNNSSNNHKSQQHHLTTCHFSFKAHTTSINALMFNNHNNNILMSSDDTQIKFWCWSTIVKHIQSRINNIELIPLTCLPSPQKEGKRGSLAERSEINGIDIDNDGRLYFGCGDSNAYCYDMNTMQKLTQFQGHKDYIHSVKLNKRNNSLVTSSEDGTVRIWDTRDTTCNTILCPKQQKSISESDYKSSNDWVGPIGFDETGNWLAVGGSIPSMWYLGKLNTMSSILSSKPSDSVYSLIFEKDRILTCGTEGVVNYYGLDGKLLMKVPSTSDILYTLSYNPHQKNQILVTGGTSPLINTYINNENIAFSYYFTNVGQ